MNVYDMKNKTGFQNTHNLLNVLFVVCLPDTHGFSREIGLVEMFIVRKYQNCINPNNVFVVTYCNVKRERNLYCLYIILI